VIAAGGAAALAATAVVAVGGASAAAKKPAKTVKGTVFTRAGSAKPGTKVAGGGLRILVGATGGWKLVSFQSAQYAAKTTDGGRTWRIASPALHIDALDAPQAVTQIGARSAKVAYAFGGGGQVADVTSNGGKTWYQALFTSGAVTAIVPASISHRLVAYVEPFPKSSTLQYVSKNGGRTWTLNKGTA
jgi:hypothetical protein